MRTAPLPLAVSIGEPAGIGPDIIAMAFLRRAELDLPPFLVYGDAPLLVARAARLGITLPVVEADAQSAVEAFGTALPVYPVGPGVADRPGEPGPHSASLVTGAIEAAVADTLRGLCAAVVTAPIHKHVLYEAGFRFPGHTEFLAALTARDGVVPHPVMMLADDDLRVVPATIHVPFAAVPGLLTETLLVETGRIVSADLTRRFGIAHPRLGFCGLNPHAGEAGSMGREEIEVIGPALKRLRAEGIAAEGPFPADTLFHLANWRRFDAVIAMYHDQGLIPIKTVAFDRAVNITLGLPIIRTSPDHGTAFDLAGTGKARPESFLAALRLAARLRP